MSDTATASNRMAALREATHAEQSALLEIPFVKAAVAGRLTLDEYLAFLGQAYHHVKHTVPLLMSTGAVLGAGRPALQTALCHYVDEEQGHEQWILNDIEACGGDPDVVRDEEPGQACEVLVAYAYDVIRRRNPLGFFGMVHVLEGTSVLAASQAADALGTSLGLSPSAFSYLSSHGALDLDHVDFFAGVLDLLEPHELEFVSKRARTFYSLYGDIFRALSPTVERHDP
jgi:pyrroloquinoline quinone (PQQ) biosynthesis protein C